MEKWRKEYLGSEITALVSDEHTFGTDAVLLADFANIRTKDTCCDLGTGCGIIPLLWCKNEVNKILAVEISEKAAAQAKAAVELNNLADKVEIINTDLRELKGIIPAGSVNVVTMNPPYTAEGAGIMSSGEADKIARHGTMCDFDDICASASYLLNFGGKLCMCIRPERMCELFVSMQRSKIEPKRIRFVAKRPGNRPWLVLVEGRRGGKSGLTVESELFVYGESEEYSKEMKEIYKDYLLEQR